MEYMLTFHILNVYVDKTQPRQFKFTFKMFYTICHGPEITFVLINPIPFIPL